jgi:capsular polysaccharide transport system ATP-binding protein
MISLERVSKALRGGRDAKSVLSCVDLDIPTDRRIAVLGASSAHKRMLIDLLAGIDLPTGGRIVRRANVSFPVGDLPGFSRDLSIRINVAHVARLYGADVRQTISLVEACTKLDEHFDRAFSKMPRNKRRQLAYAVVFSLPFDTYLLTDDSLAREWCDGAFGDKSEDSSSEIHDLFGARLRSAGMIIPTDDLDFAQRHCELGLLLNRGTLALTQDFDQLPDSRTTPLLESRKRRDERRAKSRSRREERGSDAAARRRLRRRRKLRAAKSE